MKLRAWNKKTKEMRVNVFLHYDGFIFNKYGSSSWELRDCVLMLFINREDKNKKEIYEGDIVKDNSGQVFIQGLCGAKKIIKEPTNATTDFEWEEVIGNIYKNPELLK